MEKIVRLLRIGFMLVAMILQVSTGPSWSVVILLWAVICYGYALELFYPKTNTNE